MMSDVPFGVLLSGGLDSSIIAGLMAKHRLGRIETNETEEAYFPHLHGFSVGMENSPDVENARLVAEALGITHHVKTFTLEEAISVLDEVIFHLETYDTTTIRSSVPMFLMAKMIRSFGIKMVLSGEGSDEIFGGYLYFAHAPNKEEFSDELYDKVSKLSKFDCLRANKIMMASSVECRVPFLSTPFLKYAMGLDPSLKMSSKEKMEKWLLRDAFRNLGIPDEVLWRRKEQFSDGVGTGWIDGVKKYAESLLKKNNTTLEEQSKCYKTHPPRTAEEVLYRNIFHQHFPSLKTENLIEWGDTVACSTKRGAKWVGGGIDPSGHFKI